MVTTRCWFPCELTQLWEVFQGLWAIEELLEAGMTKVVDFGAFDLSLVSGQCSESPD